MSIENEVKKLTAVVQQLTDAVVRHNLLIAGEDAAVLNSDEPALEPEQEAPPPAVSQVNEEAPVTSADLISRRRRGKGKPGAPTGLPFEVANNG